MQSYTTISEALGAVRTLAYNPPTTLSAELVATLVSASNEISPVSAIVNVSEALYARRDELGNDELAIAAGLASFATENGWHGLAVEDRGVGMVTAMRREAGESPIGRAWATADKDPEAKAEFAKPLEIIESDITSLGVAAQITDVSPVATEA